MFERLGADVAVETQNEIRLHKRNMAQDSVDVIRNLPDLLDADILAGLGLVSKLEPGFDAGHHSDKSIGLQPLQPIFGKNAEAAFSDESHPARRHDILDGSQIVIESNAEIRVVPADDRPLDLGQQELEIMAQVIEGERLIVDSCVDAKAAGVRTRSTSCF